MFCENCVKKITIDNSIKCPLCRGVQEMLCNYKLTNEECNIIMKEFTRTQEEYKIGKNYLPFNQIIKKIAENNNIKVSLTLCD